MIQFICHSCKCLLGSVLNVLAVEDMFIIGQCNVQQWTGCQGFEEGPRSSGMRNFPNLTKAGIWGLIIQGEIPFGKMKRFVRAYWIPPFCNNMAYVILLSLMV